MDWRDTNIMWVSGGIDSYGVVTGHPCLFDGTGDPEHTPEEKAHTPWRWHVSDQMMMHHMIPQKRDLTDEEWVKIQDWLVSHGYADDSSFN